MYKLNKYSNSYPLVSVVVPSYNHKDFIEECILSILGQSYPNIELLVIDDGSTDGSIDTIKSLLEKYDFSFISKENEGVAKTLNLGIKKTAGELICLCASDDYWHINKVAKQVDYMINNPTIYSSYCGVVSVDGRGKINHAQTERRNSNLKGGDLFDSIILNDFQPPVSFIYSRALFNQIGTFREGMHTEDFEFNLRNSVKYEIGFISDRLFYYRILDGRNNTRLGKTRIIHESHLACIDHYSDLAIYPKAKRLLYYRAFCAYSPYWYHKFFSMNMMVKSRGFLFSLGYLKAIVKLALFWK